MQSLLQHPQFAGSWRMLVAMLMSGTIGLFVVESGQDTATVVFYLTLIRPKPHFSILNIPA